MEYIFPKISVVIYVGIGTIILGVLILLGISWGKKGPLNYIFGSIVCIAVGIFLILFGLYTWKFNPESWSRNPMTWLEQKDWPSYIYTGAFLVCGGMIFYWLGF